MNGVTRRGILLVPAAALLAAGCQTIRPAGTTVDQTGAPPIALDVARIDVIDEYVPPRMVPFIDHLMARPPSQAIRDWQRMRLIAVGNAGTARLVIERASLEEAAVPTGGPFGLRGSGWRLLLALTVRLEVQGSPSLPAGGFARADVERRTQLGDGIGPVDRSAAQTGIVEAGIVDLDLQMQRSIRQYLGPVVRN